MENALYISFLENRIEELKLLSCDDDCQDTINYCNKLKAENKELESKVSSLAMRLSLKPYSLNKRNEELKAEIRQLKADIKHDAKVCEDVDDEYIKEINAVKQCYEGSKMKVEELKADNVRLMNQVSSNRGSNSNTHTHTIKREIAEYMSHNPTCKEARLFIVPIEEFDEDECCNKWITWDEGIEV